MRGYTSNCYRWIKMSGIIQTGESVLILLSKVNTSTWKPERRLKLLGCTYQVLGIKIIKVIFFYNKFLYSFLWSEVKKCGGRFFHWGDRVLEVFFVINTILSRAIKLYINQTIFSTDCWSRQISLGYQGNT